MLKASSDVAWKDHASSPVSMSSATIASLFWVVGRLRFSPVPAYTRPRAGSMVGLDQTAAPEGAHCGVPTALASVASG